MLLQLNCWNSDVFRVYRRFPPAHLLDLNFEGAGWCRCCGCTYSKAIGMILLNIKATEPKRLLKVLCVEFSWNWGFHPWMKKGSFVERCDHIDKSVWHTFREHNNGWVVFCFICKVSTFFGMFIVGDKKVFVISPTLRKVWKARRNNACTKVFL